MSEAAMERVKLNVPLNRVEGDLEVHVELIEGRVVDAWCCGTLYRGFENLLLGRDALDGLAITPRICGICSTSQATAAALALESLSGVRPPSGAIHVRNLALAVEDLQSDLRQSFLMFGADFANEAHRDQPLYEEAKRRYQPFEGTAGLQVLRQSKRIVEAAALLGGQWPHSSFVVPGGIASAPACSDLVQVQLLLKQFRRWYERQILGCTFERWQQVKTGAELDAWLTEDPAHENGELGFFVRYSRALGLHKIGAGHGNFVSYGRYDEAVADEVSVTPAGFLHSGWRERLEEASVTEDISSSWYEATGAPALHPMEGETKPYASGFAHDRYTWAKAPRYRSLPAETGPLAEMLLSQHPLISDLVRQQGPNALVRQLARTLRATVLLPLCDGWVEQLRESPPYYRSPGAMPDGSGAGLMDATRGALGHWIAVKSGKIAHYQIVTPTAWNASPRDADGQRGPMEEALIGTEVRDPERPVELGYVIRSFDPCLVCTVHTLSGNQEVGRYRCWV